MPSQRRRAPAPAPPGNATGDLRMGDALQARLGHHDADPFPSVADAVYERLWRQIVNLDFAPGERLAEETLARVLGVSRTPVREALLRLGEVGLVRVSPRRGFSMPIVSPDDLIELYDLRAALETHATQRATPLVSDADIADQRARQQSAHDRAVAGSPAAADEFFRADIALHEMLHAYGGNRRSARLLTDLMGQLSLPSRRAARHPENRLAAIAEHNRILAALSERDASAATTAMADHIEAVKQRALVDLTAVRVAGGVNAEES
jgi:DNA-binding GntR family transcriptional regulator